MPENTKKLVFNTNTKSDHLWSLCYFQYSKNHPTAGFRCTFRILYDIISSYLMILPSINIVSRIFIGLHSYRIETRK